MLRFLAFLLLLAAAIGGAFAWETYNFWAPGPAANNGAAQTVVVIKPGVGLHGISDALGDAGVVENRDLFLWGVRLRRTTAALKAGEYAIPSRASMHDIMDILIAGKSIEHKITAAEGLTSEMIAKLINADAELQGAAVAVPPEGTLLPETYLFLRGATKQEILDRMEAAQEQLIVLRWP